MFIARVIGNIVSTSKNESLIGKKILIVQPIDANGDDNGAIDVAIDTVGAGIGERVLVTCGSTARMAFSDSASVIDRAIVAIIDSIEVDRTVHTR